MNLLGSDPGATENKKKNMCKEDARDARLATKEVPAVPRQRVYYCPGGLDNYYGVVTEVCFSFSSFDANRFIAIIRSFSTFRNLNVARWFGSLVEH